MKAINERNATGQCKIFKITWKPAWSKHVMLAASRLLFELPIMKLLPVFLNMKSLPVLANGRRLTEESNSNSIFLSICFINIVSNQYNFPQKKSLTFYSRCCLVHADRPSDCVGDKTGKKNEQKHFQSFQNPKYSSFLHWSNLLLTLLHLHCFE